ncbi:hypothetical protein CYMTET_38474 [Cymbomonas tetramitiformis]|uniref:Ig-like domain-containing protein n=1 Tax=Cymbomonas tetramitiformis TaxID=36881 RepID=A0AAE0F4X8_9CHLO|nr:hypothetical protein CYMTET_38474 [Cymbomonas tetramitiformis]
MEEKTVHYKSADPMQNLVITVVLTPISGPRNRKQIVEAQQAAEKSQNAGSESKKGKGAGEDKADQEGTEGSKNEENEVDRGETSDEKRGEGRDDEPNPGPVMENLDQSPGRRHNLRVNAPAQSEVSGSKTIEARFKWQEKVFAKSEVSKYVAMTAPDSALASKYKREIEEKRAKNIFSGEQLYTYVHADEFSQLSEETRHVTTSPGEHFNHLVRLMFNNSGRNKQMQLGTGFQTMYIMAELGDEANAEQQEANEKADGDEAASAVDDVERKVLACIKAYSNGTFDMRPGFSQPDTSYRLELSSGAVYEYVLINAIEQDLTKLKKAQLRAEKMEKEALSAAESRRAHGGLHAANLLSFQPCPGPSPDAMRAVINMEIVAGRGFGHDYLYVEYFIKMDNGMWQLVEGRDYIRGITHISKTVKYPSEDPLQEDAFWVKQNQVAHWCFPIELELVCQEERAGKHWPMIYFQVFSYDSWDRLRTEGYCYLNLGDASPGSKVHYLRCWRPLGSIRDQMSDFFVGGSRELQDISSVAAPQGHSGKVLNKYGFSTETSGELKIRTNVLYHGRNVVPRQAPTASTVAAAPATNVLRKSAPRTMAAIVERARKRLAEARGGSAGSAKESSDKGPNKAVVGLSITQHPTDAEVLEGARARFVVRAAANPGAPQRLSYQWMKGMVPIEGATLPELTLRAATWKNEGSYCCEVKGTKGGLQVSKAATLVVKGQKPQGPTIQKHPTSVQARAGAQVTLRVAADGEELAYQWLLEGRELPGKDDATLLIEEVSSQCCGAYSCRVQDSQGRTVTSRSASVELVGSSDAHLVKDAKNEEPPKSKGPVIQKHPKSVQARTGAQVTLRVVADGEELAYQWLFEGRELPGKDDPTLVIEEMNWQYRGKYSCQVEDANGNTVTSNHASVDVLESSDKDLVDELMDYDD